MTGQPSYSTSLVALGEFGVLITLRFLIQAINGRERCGVKVLLQNGGFRIYVINMTILP